MDPEVDENDELQPSSSTSATATATATTSSKRCKKLATTARERSHPYRPKNSKRRTSESSPLRSDLPAESAQQGMDEDTTPAAAAVATIDVTEEEEEAAAPMTSSEPARRTASDFFAEHIESYYLQHTQQLSEANNGNPAIFPLAPFARNNQVAVRAADDDDGPPRNQSMNIFESLLDMLNVFTGVEQDVYHRMIALVLSSNQVDTLDELVMIQEQIQRSMLQAMNKNNSPSQKYAFFLYFREQLTNILDSFTLVTEKLGPRCDSTLKLLEMHQRCRELSKETLMSQMGMIGSAMKEFATTQLIFTSLHKEDQDILLRNNIQLYLQYVLARYFSSETGSEQLNWVSEGQLSIEPLENMGRISRISLNEFNTTTHLFGSVEEQRLYLQFAENIGMFFPFAQHCNGLIANMLLFYVDESISGTLIDERKIECIFREAKDLVAFQLQNLHQNFDHGDVSCIGPLIQTLKKMKNVFDESVNLSQNFDSKFGVPKQLVTSYSRGEEFWIQSRFDNFQEEYRSVTPPSRYLRQVLDLLFHGKRVSEGFIETWMIMEMERFRRVLKKHAEFQKLTDHDQEAILRSNQAPAMALTVVRIEAQKKGKDQFRQIVGVIGNHDTRWEDDYEGDLNTMKSFYLHNNELSLGKLDAHSMRCYFDTMRSLSKMVANPQIYQLFVLLTLLDVDGMPELKNFADIFELRQHYLRIFQRKLTSIGCSFHDYAELRRMLKKVRVFSRMMETFLQ